MGDVGNRLRVAREQQQLTLNDVAHRTRIPVSVLEHIERNEFDRLPGAVFVNGHLRALARLVGLDADAMVEAYRQQWPAAKDELPIFRRPLEERSKGRQVITSIAGIGAMLFAYSVVRQPSEAPTTVPARQPVMLAAAPEAAASEVDDAQPAAVVEGVRLDVQATAECWVSAVADGKIVMQRLLQPLERAMIGPANELIVRIGDPAALEYTLNGEHGRPVGDAGIPVTIMITGDNYRTFIDESQADPPVVAGTAAA
jgi:cytoskeleton protein RodZ